MKQSDQKVGARIRVVIPEAAVEGRPRTELLNTQFVRETGDGEWCHYLYLDSGSITRKAGEVVSAEFNAEILGEIGKDQALTTKVRELSPVGNVTGCTHYLYLGSKYVTLLDEPKPKPEPTPVPQVDRVEVNSGNALIGAKIRVRIAGNIIGSVNADTNGTTRISNRDYTHLVYTGSPEVISDGSLGVTAEFDAEISGTYAENVFGTTAVTDTQGYTHYLFLLDTGITLLANPATVGIDRTDPVVAEAIASGLIEAKTSKRGTTVSIDRYDTVISKREVDERIEELQEETETEFEVIRVRNDEVLATYNDSDDADQYITDNDYDPMRVVVRETDADEDDLEELSGLGELDEAATRAFGAAWSNGDINLYGEDYFDDEWARNEANNRQGLESASTYEWPLDLIDWDAAAQELKDRQYTSVSFDEVEFYGEDQ